MKCTVCDVRRRLGKRVRRRNFFPLILLVIGVLAGLLLFVGRVILDAGGSI